MGSVAHSADAAQASRSASRSPTRHFFIVPLKSSEKIGAMTLAPKETGVVVKAQVTRVPSPSGSKVKRVEYWLPWDSASTL